MKLPSLKICLLCDGTSDFCLEDLIQWTLETNLKDIQFRMIRATSLVPAKGKLSHRLAKAEVDYQPDIIVCHRDAEKYSFQERKMEILESALEAQIASPVVPAVPVKMLESWLLSDEFAIRKAANNVNGKYPLNLPNPARIDTIADPKELLFSMLRQASELPAQRLQRFNVQQARSRVSSHISDFTPLRRLDSFLEFENCLTRTASELCQIPTT